MGNTSTKPVRSDDPITKFYHKNSTPTEDKAQNGDVSMSVDPITKLVPKKGIPREDRAQNGDVSITPDKLDGNETSRKCTSETYVTTVTEMSSQNNENNAIENNLPEILPEQEFNEKKKKRKKKEIHRELLSDENDENRKDVKEKKKKKQTTVQLLMENSSMCSEVSSSPDQADTTKEEVKQAQKLELKEITSTVNQMIERAQRLENFCRQKDYIKPLYREQDKSTVPLEFKKSIDYAEECVSELRHKIRKLQEESNDYQNRLSRVAGAKLVDNNPNIMDLNDPRRPVKLAEQLSSIYDNEWTDALQRLEKMGPTTDSYQDKCVYHLFIIIKAVYETCVAKAEVQLGNLFLIDNNSDRNITWSDYPVERNLYMNTRKKTAGAVIQQLKKTLENDDIFKDIIAKSSVSLDESLFKAIKASAYYEKCIEICWQFAIQEPPMYLETESLEGQKLNKETHKEYTVSGCIVEYVVWPALYLHRTHDKNGPLLTKGVIQPKTL